jgi:hypothetical protein
MAADSLIVTYCKRKPHWIFHDAMPKLVNAPLTLIFGCGNHCVICFFRNYADQFIHFGRMGQCIQLIAECVRFKIVDTLLTHTLITSKQPWYTQLLYAMNHIHILDMQYCVCMYYRLLPGVLLPLTFWSTAIYAIWVWNDVALSHSRAFGRQLTACRSYH